MNQMGRSQIGYRNDDVPWYYAWNPGGRGCSGGCDGCWAKAMAGRMGPHCPKCKAFEVHLHEERLRLPACTNPLGVVLANFTCDTCDSKRPIEQIHAMMKGAFAAPHHHYVWLTKRPKIMAREFISPQPNWSLGLSVCTQTHVDMQIQQFTDIPGRKWLSVEPIWTGIHIRSALLKKLDGIVIGHDNRKAQAPRELTSIISLAAQCQIAGVPCYTKQAWLRYDKHDREITEMAGLWNCDTDKFKLIRDAGELHRALPFGHDTRVLPWTMPEVMK